MSSSYRFEIWNVKMTQKEHTFRKTHNIAEARMNSGICMRMNLLGNIRSTSFLPPARTFRLLPLAWRIRSGYHRAAVANDKIPFWGLDDARFPCSPT